MTVTAVNSNVVSYSYIIYSFLFDKVLKNLYKNNSNCESKKKKFLKYEAELCS